MTEREALKLALSVLNEVRSETFRLLRNGQKLYAEEKVWNAIFAIKKALAQPEQEPVAWMQLNKEHISLWKDNYHIIPLYTTPPQRTWVKLTKEEVEDIEITWEATSEWPTFGHAVRYIEAVLEEKNT